jgi:threonine dehydrogenase-like Zn-dependent dehydrogenase
MFCWLLQMRGAEEIIGIDPIEWRCTVAREMGATRTYAMRSLELVHQARMDSAGWEPPEICIEAVGHQTVTINDCLELVRDAGTVLAFGVADDDVYAFEYDLFYRKNLNLIAAVNADWSTYLPAACELFCAHAADLSRLVTHRIPMANAAEGYALYETRQPGVMKVLLDATTW